MKVLGIRARMARFCSLATQLDRTDTMYFSSHGRRVQKWRHIYTTP